MRRLCAGEGPETGPPFLISPRLMYALTMRVIADLHIHSRFSRATSKRLGLALLDRWARVKGLGLLGTGDCTHPGWLGELRDQLEEAEEGFYTLKGDIRAAFEKGPALAEGLPDPEGGAAEKTRFVLTGEISTLYRQGDRIRKVHHLVILPDFAAVAAFQTKLERVGNIRSDGRPILGINSRDLMGLLLDADEQALLIPAHIWTPWFSALGAKSGFDSIEECYGDLSSLIPAVETGLSSNPPMNWALSSLDRYRIISNSDAHSPDKLGREATALEMDLSYRSLREALFAAGNPGAGLSGPSPDIIETIEFFPQEGKYHYDGHRVCGVFLNPGEAAALGGLCPVCGKPMTRGVMGRVLELADRPVDETAPCPENFSGTNRRPYRSLIPLREILGELLETGPSSKKIDAAYGLLIKQGGSEFSLLMDLGAGELERLRFPGGSGELLAAAITGMRAGQVSVSPGYDGEYGVIRALPPGEGLEARLFGGELPLGNAAAPAPVPALPPVRKFAAGAGKPKYPRDEKKKNGARIAGENPVRSLNREQEAAVSSRGNFAVIIAGPGTGKTAALAARITRLIEGGADPSSILALSFTVKAAAELRDRVSAAAPRGGEVITATFHSFCTSILRKEAAQIGLSENFRVIPEEERELMLRKLVGAETVRNRQVQRLGKYIESRKQFLLLPKERKPPFGGLTADLALLAEDLGIPPANGRGEWFYRLYREDLLSHSLLDFDDLITVTARLLAINREILGCYQSQFRHILVDEYQDVNFAQYALIRLLSPPGGPKSAGDGRGLSLWIIGDPNQAIYGFRGSDKRLIERFRGDYAGAEQFHLTKSFRCAAPLTAAAGRLMGTSLEGRDAPVNLYRLAYPTDKAEAESIARRISGLIGGSSFFAIDSGAGAGTGGEPCNPGDCAILLRTTALAASIIKALEDHGIPFDLTGERPWWEEEPVRSFLDFLRPPPAISGTSPAAPSEIFYNTSPNMSPAETIRGAWETMNEQLSKKKPRGDPRILPEGIARLVSLAGFFHGIPELLDTLSFSGPEGVPEIKREGVKIMSIHAAKGLEFDHVFVAAVEEGLLPFTLYDTEDTDRDARLAEERRLLYVAMTRARKSLYLSWARSRNFKGRILKNEPGRFLTELESLIPLLHDRPPPSRDSQLRLF